MDDDPNEPQEKRPKMTLELPRPSIELPGPSSSGTPLEERLGQQGSLDRQLQLQSLRIGGSIRPASPSAVRLPLRSLNLRPQAPPQVPGVCALATVQQEEPCPHTGVSGEFVTGPAATFPPLERTRVYETHDSPVKFQPSLPQLPSGEPIKLFPVSQGGTSLEWEHFLPYEPADDQDFYEASFTTNATVNYTTSSENSGNDATHQPGGKHTLSPQLFLDSPLTVKDSIVSILMYASSCHLSGVDFCKLLDLLHLLLPKPNNLPSSKHIMFSIFKNDKNAMNVIYYCNSCWKFRSSPQDKCDKCKNSVVKYFITCSIISQLQKFYARPGFVEKLSYRHKRTKENVDNIEDVYDSAIYKEAEKTFRFDDFHISLTWYTDGVALFNCSSYSLWPFIFVINELPPEERYKEENLIVGGLWGDSDKPHPNVFLLPIYKEVMKMKEGFSVTLPEEVEVKEAKAIVLFGTCDVPAKASFMNMKGHAGYHSCPKCFVCGEKSDRTDQVMVFPHEDSLLLRSDQSYQDCVEKAVNSKTEERGVNGPSVLSFMIYSSFIRSTNVDSMHAVSLGIVKQLLRAWFDPKFSKKPFSLVNFVEKVNKYLKQLHLPHFVERLPEDVTKLHFWKASLCRNFLLYIALIIMKQVMKPAYFSNLCLLVNGVALLHKSSIDPVSDINLADQYLCQFSKEFEILYGVRHMSSNIHLLRHLPSSVVDCGNLCLTSCFKFEELNGKLAALVHGTIHVTKQIYKNLQCLSELPLLVNQIQSKDAKDFCKKLLSRNYLTLNERVAENINVIGDFDAVTQHFQQISALTKCLVGSYEIRTFSKIFKHGTLFVSSSYSQGSRVSSYCRYQCVDGHVHGQILCFVKVCTDQPCYFAYLSRSDNVPVENVERYVIFCSANAKKDLVPITNIISLCWCLQIDEVSYLVEPLNKFEME